MKIGQVLTIGYMLYTISLLVLEGLNGERQEVQRS